MNDALKLVTLEEITMLASYGFSQEQANPYLRSMSDSLSILLNAMSLSADFIKSTLQWLKNTMALQNGANS